jgi:hypothetical protein
VPKHTFQSLLPNSRLRIFLCHIYIGLSIIPRTSTIRGVATRRYARNVLSKSNDQSRQQLIWFPNRRLVPIACRIISEWYTPRPLGGPGLAGMVRYVFPFFPSMLVSGLTKPAFVRSLCHGQILPRGHLRHQRSRGRGHVAVRVSALIALRS